MSFLQQRRDRVANVVQRTGVLQDGTQTPRSIGCEILRSEQLVEGRALLWCGGLLRERDEQRLLAFSQIAVGVLPRHRRIPERADDVVAELERLAERSAESGKCISHSRGPCG